MAEQTAEPPAGSNDGGSSAGQDGPTADGTAAEPHPAADPGDRRAGADRDGSTPGRSGSRSDAEKDEKDTYDPEDDLPLRHKRVLGRQLFSPTAFGSRLLGENAGQAALGDNAHAVETVHGNVIGTATIINEGVGGRAHMVAKVARDRLGDDNLFVESGAPGQTVVEQLVQHLVSTQLVVLTGRSGSGRTTAAMRALHRVLPPDVHIATFTLGSLIQLQQMRLDPETSYVVDIAPAPEGGSLVKVLENLKAYAERRRIVVIVDCPSSTATSAGCPVVEQLQPDLRDVLRKLLIQVHRCPEDRVNDLKQEVLDTLGDATVQEVAVTAIAVATAWKDDQEAHAYLRDEVRRAVADKFDRALTADDPDVGAEPDHSGRATRQAVSRTERIRTYRRCVLLAAAVLDGFSLHQVTDAAADLASILYEDVPDLNALAVRFDLPARPLLEWLEAREQPTAEVTSAGRLEFRNRAVPDVAVEYVWTSHHLAVDAIIDWLDGMARIRRGHPFPSREVRLRAAQVVGRLASYDFDYVVRNVIEKWIEKNTVSALQATARAVEVMADDPRIATATWEKVRGWSDRSWKGRRAALIVYADSLRPDQAADALALVRRTANPTYDLGYAIAAVLRSAVRVGFADEVFRLLAEWLRTIEHTRRRLERLRFVNKVRVASGLPAHLARSLVLLSADDEDGTRAHLVEKCRADPDFAVGIWRLALADAAVAERATDRLRSWLIAAELDAELAEVVRHLLTGLRRHASLHRRLQFHARRWITEWRGTYPEAERLLRAVLWADDQPPEGAFS